MRDWILLAVALAVAPAGAARAQMAGAPDGGAPPQVIMVSPPPAAGDGGGGPVVIVTEGDGGTPVATGPGEPDAGPGEEVLLLVPAKKPPPPEAPRQIHVTVMHQPRPRVEWGQAALELGISSGVYVLGSAALFAGELVPIIISELFGAHDVSNVLLDVFSLGNAVVLPLATTIALEKTKAYSRHYELEGLGWWATYGSGVVLQLISAGITISTLNVQNLQVAPHLVVFGALTPVTQTVVANALATPRDPLAPLEAHAPLLLDGDGRPIRVVRVLSISF